MARNIQKLQLTHTETVIFAAFSLFFTGWCRLDISFPFHSFTRRRYAPPPPGIPVTPPPPAFPFTPPPPSGIPLRPPSPPGIPVTPPLPRHSRLLHPSLIPSPPVDKCDLQCPEIVESSQQLLLDTFTYQLSRPQRDGHAKEHQKSHQNRRLLLARSLLVLPEMRTLTDTLRRAGQSFRSAWSVDAFQCPPLFHELLFLGQQNCVDDPVILQFEAELA